MKAVMMMLVLALAACGGKKDEKPAEPGSSAATPTGSGSAVATGSGSAAPTVGSGSGSAAVPVTAAAPEAALPTEVDFEDDASARITEKNIDVELKALESQLTR